MNIHDSFAKEYDLDSLISVSPRGQDFSFLVTPRYRARYQAVEYEAFTARYLRAILPQAAIFVDVGAHYGFFSLLAASVNKDLHIISAEPVTETREVLVKNIEQFGARRKRSPRFTVCGRAISEGVGTCLFNISLSSDNCGFYSHPNAAPIRQVAVETTSLDALMSNCGPGPLVVKIDTEGHELAVLRGMRETLSRFEDVTLVVELNPTMQALAGVRPQELLAEIEANGFAVFIVHEARGQAFRVSSSSDWERFVEPGGYANLICFRKSQALSICFFGHSSGAGGAERNLASLVKDLVGHHGALCTVFLPQPGPLETLIRDAGASCVVTPYAWWCYSPHREKGDAHWYSELSASLLRGVTDLLPLVRDIDPDVICTQTMVIPWGAAVAATLKKPHIWSICEYGELDHGLRFASSFNEIAADIEEGADFLFFAAKDIKTSLYPSLAEDRWDFLYCHIEIESCWEIAADASDSPRPLRLAIFGNLSPSKGQADAIAATAILKSRGIPVQLSVVGSGRPGYGAELRRRTLELGLTDEEVRVKDFLMNPYPEMARADVALVCSRREAFGRVALEAMLLGKPVVYAAAGGIAEYMRDGETGLGYPPGDVTALADRVETLARDATLRARLGAAARDYARSTFSRDQFSGKFYCKALELRGSHSRAHFPITLLPSVEKALGAIEPLKAEKTSLEKSLAEAERRAAELGATLDEAQDGIATLKAKVAEQEGRLAELAAALDNRTAQLDEGQSRIAAIERSVAEREQRAAEVGAELAEARSRITALETSVAERERELAAHALRMAAIKASLSWRLMAPFREIYRPVRLLRASRFGIKLRAAWRHPRNSRKRKQYRASRMQERVAAKAPAVRRPSKYVARLRALARHPFSRKQRRAYRERLRTHAPVVPCTQSPGSSDAAKLRIKHTLFTWAAPLFRHTVGYRDWESWQRWQREQQAPSPSSHQPARDIEHAAYVPPYEGEPPSNPPARLIAFYLPQFHPIPENDAFWGKGFTEWTNVVRATPQFEGHYQPRLPGELGFYDLRVPEVQKRQIELAKQYGLYGFCFHFYWFAGKRLLEIPLERFVTDLENEFRFCINWANENWTRRWDGREHEVLVAQGHSPQDDLAFIEYVSRYLRDPRYIRVDGKPLLLVYRPGILPSAKETASRWRQWCRENGIGEIHLAYTQSFDSADPAEFGFDAAIEFPPNLGRYPVTNQVKPLAEDYQCNTYDWSKHLERSRNYEKPSYVLYRGLCPSWDNTARRGNKASILLNSSPAGYQEWLSNAITDTCQRFPTPDQRLVFINGWNEWAEGAYLEPDAKQGYAYLEATRVALVGAQALFAAPGPDDPLFQEGFPLCPDPRVSIVMPVYNQVDYTLRCLDSVRRNTRGRFEVIVVDDCSSDDTNRIIPSIKNVRYVRNAVNLGFLRTSNVGATQARGEFILFLNNDTEVLSNWLEPLVDLLERNDKAAIVGSKLVYADGTLQEAGGIYWQDGRGTNYGRGDRDPARPQYNYVREVDKCSGASLLVRTEIFKEIGGFDARFAPAYKEDADICFSARKLGYKVLYQPRSVVVHHEGISCGRDVTTGIKQYQELNRENFVKKWETTLALQHLANTPENIPIAKERPHGRKVVLVADCGVPEHDRHAGGMGMFHYTKLFIDLGYKVVFIADDRRRLEPYTTDLQQLGVEVHYGGFDFQAILTEYADRIDVAWLSRPMVASKYIDALREKTSAKVIYCGRDLHHLRLRRQAEIEGRPELLVESEKCKALEMRLFGQSDIVVTFSQIEYDLIVKMLPAANVRIVSPYVLDVKRSAETAQAQGRNAVIFVGNFYHDPNVDAAKWFVENCWQRIKDSIPTAYFVVIGSGATDEIQKLRRDDIRVVGHVQDLSRYFGTAIASVAPVRYGAGVKGKIVTSMSQACPVVTTTLGAEGMGLVHQADVLIADDAKGFADHVIALSRDQELRATVVRGGQAYVEQRYSSEKVRAHLLAILKELALA
jgi:FkbM family methyltransferase